MVAARYDPQLNVFRGKLDVTGNINPSYVSRVLRMARLAPEIVEALLAEKQPHGLTMAGAMQRFPVEWRAQRHTLTSE